MQLIPDLARLAQIFAQATAPAFFLGAVAGFVSLMSARLNTVVSRMQKLNQIGEDHPYRGQLMSDMTRLRRRARLLSDGISATLLSGLAATVLLAVLFLSELIGIHHAYGGAFFFIVATLALGWGLMRFFQEARLGLAEADEYD